MTAFIHQEAREKARELRLKAEEEYAVERARLLRAELAGEKEYEDKRAKEMARRVMVARGVESQRVRIKVELLREELIHTQIYDLVKRETASLSCDIKFIQALIKEALDKIGFDPDEAGACTIECRQSDGDLVKNVLRELHIADLKIQNTLPDTSLGGIIVSKTLGHASKRLQCDNTIKARLQLAIEGTLPMMRSTLFGANPNRKFDT